MTRHDLIAEKLLTWRGSDHKRHHVTLPGLLAALSSGDVVDFPRARAHQQQPWSMFLTQLGAIALKRGGLTIPPHDENAWIGLLLALTNQEREGWCLFVEDLTKPAFFQTPVPEGTLAGWKRREETPDELDILVTSKNHDVKSCLVAATNEEAWALSLCSLQTMQGYPGRGYVPISRMNGGYGNRPRVGLSSALTHGARFSRDIQLMMNTWSELIERGFSDDGVGLVWLLPWDGAAKLPISKLAPHFIEVCSRARLVQTEDERFECLRTTASARRCAPEIDGGDVGDTWIPIDRGGRALTVGRRGYHYSLLVKILFEAEFSPAPAQKVHANDPDGSLLWAWALARGQGKTEGLHERLLPLSAKIRRTLLDTTSRSSLGQRAEERVQGADRMRGKVLFPALKALADETPADSFDSRVDERFFDALFASLDVEPDQAQAIWQDELAQIAQSELDRMIELASLPDARRYRLASEAERMFFGCLKKQFPDVVARRNDARKLPREPMEVTQ